MLGWTTGAGGGDMTTIVGGAGARDTRGRVTSAWPIISRVENAGTSTRV